MNKLSPHPSLMVCLYVWSRVYPVDWRIGTSTRLIRPQPGRAAPNDYTCDAQRKKEGQRRSRVCAADDRQGTGGRPRLVTVPSSLCSDVNLPLSKTRRSLLFDRQMWSPTNRQDKR